MCHCSNPQKFSAYRYQKKHGVGKKDLHRKKREQLFSNCPWRLAWRQNHLESTADGRSLASPHLSDGSTGPSCCERKPLYLCKASWFHVKKTYPSGLCFALPCASFIQLQKPGISPLLSSTVNQQFREQTGVNLHTAPRSVKGHTQALMPNFLDRSGKGNHPKNGSPAVIDGWCWAAPQQESHLVSVWVPRAGSSPSSTLSSFPFLLPLFSPETGTHLQTATALLCALAWGLMAPKPGTFCPSCSSPAQHLCKSPQLSGTSAEAQLRTDFSFGTDSTRG